MPKIPNKLQIPNRASVTNALPQVQELFSHALTLHQNGQIAQAQEIYSRILLLQPRHFDALHLLGVIAAQTKNFQKAVELFAKALAIKSSAGAYMNYGNALRELKQHAAAIKSYDSAIKLKPDFADAYNNRGNALQDLKRHQLALES